MLTFLKRTKFPNHVVCEMLLTCWYCIRNLISVPCGVFMGTDLSIYPQNPNYIYVWKAADMLTLLKQTKCPNHEVCERLLTSWLCLNRPNFWTMWCVKSHWLADFAKTDKISKPCGVWNDSDLLTSIKERKFPNHVVCAYGFLQYLSSEYKLYICVKSCWHADFVSTY
jgi:hypothetical protein